MRHTVVPELRVHGDQLLFDGALDFAVNVWPGTRPAGLERTLREALERPGYPDDRDARDAIAAHHGRRRDEVLLTNGACEAFWLIAHALRPRRAACVHPSFTEPEAALRATGADVVRVFREPGSWRLDPDGIPRDAALVVVGNPDNPTGAIESAETLAGLDLPGRLVVIDESFMEFVPGQQETLAARRGQPGIVVVRSLTKLWSLAGVRAGYLLAEAPLIKRLESHRQPWSVNAIAGAALEYCAADHLTPVEIAAEVASARSKLFDALSELPIVQQIWPGAANFLLLRVKDGPAVVSQLAERAIAVRPASSFPGLGPDHLRVAVRPASDCARLVAALREIAA
jgi:histidinol-phosphate/aromatic aminotransferase/cobyric acid decarboxylase-like protein